MSVPSRSSSPTRRSTGADDSAFDLVTSTMLLHELPPKEIEQTFAEAARVLQPGGRMVHLDFYLLPDAFSRFIHYGHARRNNEPFMPPLCELDLTAMLERLGFSDVEITPFAEADGVDTTDSPTWRFPWTVISATR